MRMMTAARRMNCLARSCSRKHFSCPTAHNPVAKERQRRGVSRLAQKVVSKEVREAKLKALETYQFCRICGSPMTLAVPAGETELRHQCSREQCSYIEYLNPKVVAGCLVEHNGKVMLCKRALEPCSGLWTLPAGYLELEESSAEGAARETWEEACARVNILGPYAHLDIPVIGQSYLIFRAELADDSSFGPGPESEAVEMFSPDEIPFDSIAFSSIHITLKQWVEDKKLGRYSTMHGVIRKRPGSSPRDMNAFVLEDTFHSVVSPA